LDTVSKRFATGLEGRSVALGPKTGTDQNTALTSRYNVFPNENEHFVTNRWGSHHLPSCVTQNDRRSGHPKIHRIKQEECRESNERARERRARDSLGENGSGREAERLNRMRFRLLVWWLIWGGFQRLRLGFWLGLMWGRGWGASSVLGESGASAHRAQTHPGQPIPGSHSGSTSVQNDVHATVLIKL